MPICAPHTMPPVPWMVWRFPQKNLRRDGNDPCYSKSRTKVSCAGHRDPIPKDKDAVIMVEDIVKNGDGSITIHAAAAPWQISARSARMYARGNDFAQPYDRFPGAIGAMIAGGCAEIEVIRKPVVGIIPTGDEIIRPCTDPKPGDILEFNGSIFSAMVRSWGARGGGLSHCSG